MPTPKRNAKTVEPVAAIIEGVPFDLGNETAKIETPAYTDDAAAKGDHGSSEPVGNLTHNTQSNVDPNDPSYRTEDILASWERKHEDIPAVKADVQATLQSLADVQNVVDGSITSRLALCFADAAVMFLKSKEIMIAPAMQTSLHSLIIAKGIVTKEQAMEYAPHLKAAEIRACLVANGNKTRAAFGYIAKTDCKGTRFTLTMPFQAEGDDETHYRAICVPANVLTPNFFSTSVQQRTVVDDDGKSRTQDYKRAIPSEPNPTVSLRYLNEKLASALYYHHFRGDDLILDMERVKKGDKIEDPTGMIVGSESKEQKDERLKKERDRLNAVAKKQREAASQPNMPATPETELRNPDGTEKPKESRDHEKTTDDLLRQQLSMAQHEARALAAKNLSAVDIWVALNTVIRDTKVAIDQDTGAAILADAVSFLEYRVIGNYDVSAPDPVLQQQLIELRNMIDQVVEREHDASNMRVYRMKNSSNVPVHVLTGI